MSPSLVSLTATAGRLNRPPGGEASAVVPIETARPPADMVAPAAARTAASAQANHPDGVRLSEVVGALSYALDLTEGQPLGHAVRTTIIGMRIADQLMISDEQKSALFYALLLKDLGCSSNAARLSSLFGADDRLLKHAYKLTDWTATSDTARYAFKYSLPGRSNLAKAWHALMLGTKAHDVSRSMITTRCERGADIARMLGLPKPTTEAIRALDEHWDGRGMPYGLRASGIPLLARIAGLAQTVEVFATAFDVRTAYEMAHARKGRWFDPALVGCLDTFEMDAAFWGRLRGADTLEALQALEPADRIIRLDEDGLDTVAEAFAKVIDAKSPFTARHSQNVAFLSVRTGEELGCSRRELRTLRRAALLHDIGKLGVSNAILDKPGSLDSEEFDLMRQHTRFSYDILKRVTRFRQFAATAAAHHERLDGSGYHLGLRGEEIGVMARIIAVSDVCEAISADRPYRAGMPLDEVLRRLNGLVEAGHLDPAATEGLCGWFTGIPKERPVQAVVAA
ncbi:MAG: HD domain-containing phosphohydrolase [Gemmatimonadales bacterium]|nr:HD domain-containing phosphohydrolase [Gemmatimonadales bacterium]